MVVVSYRYNLFHVIFYFLGWGEIFHLVRQPLYGPFVRAPDDLMGMELSVEWELAGEDEALVRNLAQCHFVHHKSHMT
jgi:hypothetical protein